jgi:hypothetical protein
MLGSGMLEMAIGLIFMYLLLSLVCTAVNEFIASAINKRGTNLFEGVKNLLNDPRFTGLAQHIYSHGLVDGMSKDASDPKKANRKPSYLPSATFALALSDILTSHGAIAQAGGAAFDAAKDAEDAYEAELWNAGGSQQDHEEKLKTLDEARTKTMNDLKQAAAANASAGAVAALAYFEAKRAAIALAQSPKDTQLLHAASSTLETALDEGRRLAAGANSSLATIKAALDRLPPGHTKESLKVMVSKTEREAVAGVNEVRQFEHNVAAWFDSSMDRVSGWYKRWTQAWLLGLAAVLVIALNADTLNILQRLQSDTALRTALTAAASDAVRNGKSANDEGVTVAVQKAENLALPIGWTLSSTFSTLPPERQASIVVFKLLGLVMTILAVSLGAPFWFDMLQKIVNLRGAGAPPASTAPTKPK